MVRFQNKVSEDTVCSGGGLSWAGNSLAREMCCHPAEKQPIEADS
jgi:hypothetical protein